MATRVISAKKQYDKITKKSHSLSKRAMATRTISSKNGGRRITVQTTTWTRRHYFCFFFLLLLRNNYFIVLYFTLLTAQQCADINGRLATCVPLACFPDPKFWQKRTQKLWYTAGWESRSVGWVTGVDARATGTWRLRGDDALASMPPHAHRGDGPVFLTQLSSTDNCTCPLAPQPCWTGSLTHKAVCIPQTVCSSSHRQRSSAVYNGCREAGTTARASGGLRAARIAPTTTNHGCNIAPTTVLQTMVCTRDAICIPYTNHAMVCKRDAICIRDANCIPCNKPWFVYGVQFAPRKQTMVCTRDAICT
jgi:hypothetical protein